MFEETPYLLGFLIFSIVFSYVALKYIGPPFSGIIQVLTVVGIVIHELCHLAMCVVTRSPIEHITLIKKIDYREGQRSGYYGEIQTQEERISFLQAALISLAPLFISFWLFFTLLEMLTTTQVHPVVFIVSVLIMVSISLTAAPSFADLVIIPKAFLNDPQYSWYQIFLLFISALITFAIFATYKLQEIHYVVFYLIVTGFYVGFKYGFRFISILLHKNTFFEKKHSKKRKFKKLARRRHRPEKERLHYSYKDLLE